MWVQSVEIRAQANTGTHTHPLSADRQAGARAQQIAHRADNDLD